MNPADTIAAISSSVRPAARIIVRCSGPQALSLAAGIVTGGVARAAAARAHLFFRGLRVPAWVYSFAGPRSFTGEDTVEFHIPGNPLLARMLLEELLSRGARLAEPGEFTARAYFAGKLDLTEAEGIAATISAQSEREHAAARRLLSGELTRRLTPLTDGLAQTLALVEVGIDFAEEDVTVLSNEELLERLLQIDQSLSQLVAQSARFEPLTHEPTVVLAGRPNAGKSTLLNTLAGTDRAVVSPIAGTTRDVIWSHVTLPRGQVRLTDVAGVEDVADSSSDEHLIESQMRQQAMRAIETADVLALVVDATDGRARLHLSREPDLIVLTKIDLLDAALSQSSASPSASNEVAVSCTANVGLDPLRLVIDRLCFGGNANAASLALNARHLQAIVAARAALARATDRRVDEAELLAVELREALDALGRISGRVTPDDLLGRIFSSFCIGK